MTAPRAPIFVTIYHSIFEIQYHFAPAAGDAVSYKKSNKIICLDLRFAAEPLEVEAVNIFQEFDESPCAVFERRLTLLL